MCIEFFAFDHFFSLYGKGWASVSIMLNKCLHWVVCGANLSQIMRIKVMPINKVDE